MQILALVWVLAVVVLSLLVVNERLSSKGQTGKRDSDV